MIGAYPERGQDFYRSAGPVRSKKTGTDAEYELEEDPVQASLNGRSPSD